MKHNWLLLVLLAVGLPAAVAAAEMYTWTDANGVKHFSDSPPPASVTKSQKLKLKGGVTTGDTDDEAQKDQTAKAAGPALAAAAGYSPDDIKRNCEVARKNQIALESQKPAVDAEGYPVDLDAAKNHQAQVDKASQQIKLFCGN